MPRAREQDPDAKRFGEILSSLRIARSWTLGDLGEASGMHPDFLGLLERGMNLPSLRTILRIAEVFEIPPGKIVDEIAAKRPPRRS